MTSLRILWHRTLGGAFGYHIETEDPNRVWYQVRYLLLTSGIFGTLGWGRKVFRVWSLGERVQLTVFRNWISLVFWPWLWIHELIHVWAMRGGYSRSRILALPFLTHVGLAFLVLSPYLPLQLIGIQNFACAVFTVPGDLLQLAQPWILNRLQRQAWGTYSKWTDQR